MPEDHIIDLTACSKKNTSSLTFALTQIFFQLNEKIELSESFKTDEMYNKLDAIIDKAISKKVDILVFPEYSDLIFDKIRNESKDKFNNLLMKIEKNKNIVIITSKCGDDKIPFAKLYRGVDNSQDIIQKRNLFPLEERLRREISTNNPYRVLKTNAGVFAVLISMDFLLPSLEKGNFIDELDTNHQIAGIFVLSYSYGNTAFINQAKRLWRNEAHSNLKFIAFCNVATQIPEKFYCCNKYRPTFLLKSSQLAQIDDTPKENILWLFKNTTELYEKKEIEDYFYKNEEKDKSLDSIIKLKQLHYAFGYTGVFCLKKSINFDSDGDYLKKQRRVEKDTAFNRIDNVRKWRYYPFLDNQKQRNENISNTDMIHLSTENLDQRDYLLIFKYENNMVTYDSAELLHKIT